VLTALALASLLGWAMMALGALAAAAEAVERRRLRRVWAEVAVTDAVHREFGALVAPAVSRRPWGGWTVALAVGPSDLAAAGRLAAIARHVLAPDRVPVRVVLLPTDGEGAGRGHAPVRHRAA
jgi:hypothetical protein